MKKLILVLLLSGLPAFATIGVEVHAVLSPAGHFTAKTPDVKGSCVVKGDTVEAKDVSVSLKSLDSGIPMRDEHMKNKYLEVEKYPDAVLTDAKGSGGKGTGKLKIHGIEKPISGTYAVKDGKECQAKFTITLSDYGITGIKYLGVGVKDETELVVTVPVATK